jgi:hypothetical protein
MIRLLGISSVWKIQKLVRRSLGLSRPGYIYSRQSLFSWLHIDLEPGRLPNAGGSSEPMSEIIIDKVTPH